ncbi:MAG: hypothetical protein WCC25_16300, partial [Candidatus Korobacteraceae bacterium]
VQSRDVTAGKKNEKRSMDTDFIVGTAIMYFKSKGYDCCWQHVCDDPADEHGRCGEYGPILQEGSTIKREFRPRKPNGDLWGKYDVDGATQELHKAFEKFVEGRKPSNSD